MQRKTLVTALIGVLVGALVLGGLAIAGNTGSSSDKLAEKVPFFGRMFKHGGVTAKGGGSSAQQQLSEALKTVVEKHIITKEQSGKILKKFEDAEKQRAALQKKKEHMTLKEYRQYKMNSKKNLQNPFDELVSDGVITAVQLDAIKTSIIEAAQKLQQQQMSDGLKALVDNGTITQEQSNKILKKFDDNKKERQARMKKARDIKPSERLRFLQQNQVKDPMSQLLADGTITQKQIDAIRKIPVFQKK
ncbi:MAG TPA: hypothetical protein VNT57_05745 [Desulfobacteria bacterium]|nr:hypothetical protein [Desulfobacteria bacterium]